MFSAFTYEGFFLNNLPISAIIITKNEAHNIERCCKSLHWVDEIVILDGDSSDKTRELAQTFSNVVVKTSEWLGFAETKRKALEYTKNDWIFWIDADEEISLDLKTEVYIAFSQAHSFQALRFPRKNFFCGRWVKQGNWYPDFVTRIFNKKFITFNKKEVHEGLDIPDESKVQTLQAHLHHYSYTSITQYFEKMIRYSRVGALEMLKTQRSVSVFRLFFHPLYALFRNLILKRGILGGKLGILLALGSACQTFMKYMFLYSILYLNSDPDKI